MASISIRAIPDDFETPGLNMGRILRAIRIRNEMAREFLAELLGTMILILFGDGVVAQVTLSEGLGIPKGDFFTINWGWGLGVTMAILVTGGVSGAHLNPAVTLAMVVVGKNTLFDDLYPYMNWSCL